MGRCRQLTWIRRMTTTMTATATPRRPSASGGDRGDDDDSPRAECPGFTHAASRRLTRTSIYITRCPHIVMRKFTFIVLSRRALRAVNNTCATDRPMSNPARCERDRRPMLCAFEIPSELENGKLFLTLLSAALYTGTRAIVHCNACKRINNMVNLNFWR